LVRRDNCKDNLYLTCIMWYWALCIPLPLLYFHYARLYVCTRLASYLVPLKNRFYRTIWTHIMPLFVNFYKWLQALYLHQKLLNGCRYQAGLLQLVWFDYKYTMHLTDKVFKDSSCTASLFECLSDTLLYACRCLDLETAPRQSDICINV